MKAKLSGAHSCVKRDFAVEVVDISDSVVWLLGHCTGMKKINLGQNNLRKDYN